MHSVFILDQPANVLNATNLVDGYTVERIEQGATRASGTQSGGPAESCQTPPERGTNSNTVLAVGGGVGVGIGVPLLAALIGVLVLLRKEKRANALMRAPVTEGYSQQYIGQSPEKDGLRQPTELQTVSQVRELDSRAKNTR